MNSVAFDIMQFLETSGFGTAGTDLFSYEWGQDSGGEVDKQILVLDQEGIQSPLKNQYEQPLFQILVRGNKSDSGKAVYDTAKPVWDFLNSQPTITINTVDYLGFEPLQSVTMVGRDENDRFLATMNYYTFRNPQ